MVKKEKQQSRADGIAGAAQEARNEASTTSDPVLESMHTLAANKLDELARIYTDIDRHMASQDEEQAEQYATQEQAGSQPAGKADHQK